MNKLLKNKRFFILFIDALLLLFYLCLGKITEVMIGSGFSRCVFYGVTGILCPACGGTRCVKNFAAWDFNRAFMYNQYIFFMIIYFIMAMFLLNLDYLFNWKLVGKIRRALVNYKVIVALIIGLVVFGTIRGVLSFISKDMFYIFYTV